MWWRTVLVLSLAIIDNISAQDDNNATETQTQLCCPCPPGWLGAVARSPLDPGPVVPGPVVPGPVVPGPVVPGPVVPVARGADGVDDCPCRARDADSEGAASVFFPNAVRAFGNDVRPDPKEDSKPLLHPEVDLASSVLETLREATDEEYRDALERDAARAAVDVASITDVITDGVPEEARKVVTIIVSPRDMGGSEDAMQEASHVQETRCIHSSLGNPRASFTYRAPVPRKGIEDILNLPLPNGLLHRQRDSNLAASNIHQSVVRADDNLNKILSGLRLKTEPNLLQLDPKTKSNDIKNILSGVSLRNNAEKSGLDGPEIDSPNVKMESSNDLNSSETVEESDSIHSNVLNKSTQSGSRGDLDCNTSPTSDQETVFEKSPKNTGPLKSLLFARNNEDKPDLAFPLKNLFKLRDVELVPLNLLKNKPKAKINLPSINFNPLSNTETRELTALPKQPVLFGKPSKFITNNPETGLNQLNKAKSVNIQSIPKTKVLTTEILDAVPSPSDDNCVRLKPEADKSAGVNMEELEDSLLNSSTETVENDDEKASNSIEILEVDTDILDVNSAEQIQLKSSEILDEETSETENFQIIDDTQAPVQESDSDIEIISQEEDISDVPPGSVDLSEINEAEDRSNSISETRQPLRKLEEIKKSVVDKLDALQKSNRNALDNIKHNVEEISTQGQERNQDTDLVENEDLSSNVEATFESPSPKSPVEEECRDLSASAESVSFQELQKMSDSILMASENQEQRAEVTNDASLAEFADNNSESEEISEGEIDHVLGMDGKQTQPNNGLNQSIDDSDSLKTACPSDVFKKPEQKKLKNSNDNKNTNDLETLSSDPIMDILRPNSLTGESIINILRPNSRSLVEHINDLGMKLRQSIVVQPSPLINADDFNIFRTPSLNIPDISGLNANIPTLDEIRTRVSEILDGLARTASDDDGSSEIDSDDFASDVNPVVAVGASSPDPISILPPLKPREDINLDIIQLKPLPSILGSSPLSSNLPGLNLNRYKAKLAIPKSLDIKPFNLASTLGSNGGLFGTTLTIGPEKQEKTIKSKFKSNNADFRKSSHVASNTNPTLADITSTVHKNALNLLNVPESSKRPNLKASNVMDNFANKIKSHAEDTVRNIHESLNPSSLADIHNNVLKSASNLLATGRNSLHKTLQTSTPIESAVDNLRSQTQNTMQQLHSTLHSPRVADLSNVIQKNTQSILKSPKNSIDAAVDNLRAQSENTFRNIQQTLHAAPLPDLSDSIHKTAQDILKSSAAINPKGNLLGSSMQVIPPIDKVADNLRSHTQNALKNMHQTLNAPTLSDISTSIQKSAQQVLKSPITNNRPEILKSLQPIMSGDTVVDNLRSQTQNTMRSIQNSLNSPTLADISATVQKHAQNLLQSPVALTGRDAFEQVLQASPPINLTPHVEQVAKDLQKTIKVTLKNNPLKELPPLPHPNDVIQIISNHHEDVNDKLYALHTDFTDRLESFHNEVTDPERLRSILSPPGNLNFELFAIPLPMSSRSASSALKQTRPVFQAKQSSAKLASEKKQPKKTSTVSKPKTEATKPNSMRASTRKESSPPKLFRIPSAASSPVPTHTDRPTVPQSPKKPLKGLEGIKKPVFPKFKPLGKNKVTITFGSTTQRPTPVGNSNRIVPTTAKPKVTANQRFKPKGPIRQPTPWNGWGDARSAPKRLGDPLTSPSHTPNARTSLRSKTALTPMNIPSKTEMSSRLAAPKLKSQSMSPSKPKMPKFKTTLLPQGKASVPSRPLSPINKPKSPLLTKLTDALKSKQAHGNLSQTPRQRAHEMSPAASDRFEKVVGLEEPLKEHVPYKCKMMCVKVDLNDE